MKESWVKTWKNADIIYIFKKKVHFESHFSISSCKNFAYDNMSKNLRLTLGN